MKCPKCGSIIKRKAEEENLEEEIMEEDIQKIEKKLEYAVIWRLGNKFGGGHGFWGSFGLLDHSNPKEMVRAWVDGLRERGYSEADIILYGDWSDGRHIADSIEESTTYEEFKEIVRKGARGPEIVEEENKSYVEAIEEINNIWLS